MPPEYQRRNSLLGIEKSRFTPMYDFNKENINMIGSPPPIHYGQRHVLQMLPENNNISHTAIKISGDDNTNTTVTFTDVVNELKTKYNFEESITSTSLDILALYLKGQKILHIEAKTLCEKRLHSLMLPAIMISSICAILNFALQSVPYGPVAISSCNVFNAFLMTLISYLKLDAKAQAHQSSAYKYQKLESLCEFHSGRILFFKNTEDVSSIVDDIQNRVIEIKESNQFIIPEEIRHRFNEIYSTNVFTLVKDIQNDEIVLINDLKVIVQKIQYVRGLKDRESEKKQALEHELAALEIQEYTSRINRNSTIEMYMKQEVDTIIHVEHPDVELTTTSSCRRDTHYLKNKHDKLFKELLEKTDKKHVEELVDSIEQDLVNKIRKLKESIKECEEKISRYTEERAELENKKVIALDEAIIHRKRYLKLSDTFNNELEADRDLQKDKCDCCVWCKT
jgi:hypothetical protein